jgi:protein-arginine kinase activator protein McsA
MLRAASELRYEDAAVLRDEMRSVKNGSKKWWRDKYENNCKKQKS